MNFTCLDFYNDKLARALILKSAMACCMQAVGALSQLFQRPRGKS